MKLNCQQVIDQLIADTEAINHIVKNEFQPLSVEQLNHRPAPGKWGINHCLEHLNISLRLYLRNIKRVLEKSKTNSWLAKDTYSSGWLGNMAVNGLLPKSNGVIKLKMPTLKGWDPGKDAPENPNALPVFLELSNSLINLLNQARKYDLGKAKVPTSLPLLQFKLGDSLRFIMAHNKRHIQQAQNVKAALYPTV